MRETPEKQILDKLHYELQNKTDPCSAWLPSGVYVVGT